MQGVISQKQSKKSALVLFILLLVGCSSGVIVHDQTRAAELVVDFLSSLKSDPGIKLAYEWTDDRYKDEVSFSEFSQIVSSIRGKNLGADIHLTGYEVFGSKQKFIVYASSEISDGKIYFKFSLVGTKSKDYYLIDFNISDTGFSKEGIHREYGQSIIVQGV